MVAVGWSIRVASSLSGRVSVGTVLAACFGAPRPLADFFSELLHHLYTCRGRVLPILPQVQGQVVALQGGRALERGFAVLALGEAIEVLTCPGGERRVESYSAGVTAAGAYVRLGDVKAA